MRKVLGMGNKKLLFSVRREDFLIQYFRAGGPGGQKQNKTDSACRIIHRESDAVGESREDRSQVRNRKIAFRRLVSSKKFQLWLRLKSAMVAQGYKSVEQKIDAMVAPKNLRIEYLELEQ